MFLNKYERFKEKALNFSYSINLNGIEQDDLCEIHRRLNSHKWDERLGPAPKDYDSKYGFRYSYYIMRRIADKVGDKAVARWWHIHELCSTEEEFEDWYDKQVQKAALRWN